MCTFHNLGNIKNPMMKETIQAFLDNRKVAVAGASNNRDNFGKMIMTELTKKEYEVHPVNPRCEEVDGTKCVPSVKELPADVENLILAVPPALTEEIVDQCVGTSINRVWMLRGGGKGAYSEKAHATCKDNGIEVVYGFCPMMFYGGSLHKFHLWIRERFGKTPPEYKN